MRVISGSLRGKKIFEPKDIKTRPLKDLTKESIFNIINHSNKFKVQLMGAHVLDLFSGVGSFGIECISRGASKVIFAENYVGVLPILRKNLMNIKFENNFKKGNDLINGECYQSFILENNYLCMKIYLTIFSFIFCGSQLFSQSSGDTTIIETLDFNDITKRRGWYIFPSDTSQYHKVLM